MRHRRIISNPIAVRRAVRVAGVVTAIGVCLLLAGCWAWPTQHTFSLEVAPGSIADLPQNSACVFLVSFDPLPGIAKQSPVMLSAAASAGHISLSSDTLTEGGVVELLIESEETAVGSTLTVSVTGERNGEIHTGNVSAQVTDPIPLPDDRLATAAVVRDAFLPWLASEHPEFGINADTAWTALPLRPHLLEVSYGLFQSAEWELVVWWHVTIAPHDWARVSLRRRFTETAPSFAAEIPSFSTGGLPAEIDPPEEIYR